MTTAAELLQLFLDDRAQYCNRRSIDFYRAMIGPFVRWAGDRPLDAELIKAYMAERRESGLASETVFNTFRVLKTWARWAYDDGHIEVRPFEGRGRVKRPRREETHRPVLGEAELVKLLAAPGPQRSARTRWADDGPRKREQLQSRAAVCLLVDSGIRASELCRLDCGQVRGTAPIVVTIKGGRIGRVFVSEPTRELLRQLAGERPSDAPLFLGWTGERLNPDGLRNLIERCAERAGVTLPPRAVHAFRHLAARRMLRAGIPLEQVAAVLNHKGTATTQLYVRDERSADLEARHAASSPIAELLAEACPARPWARHAGQRPGRRRRRLAA